MPIELAGLDGQTRKVSVGVFIPVLNAAEELKRLLPALATLQASIDEVLFVDSSSTDSTVTLLKAENYPVHIIARADFGHGRTRNLALSNMHSDIIIYLTQDAIPADTQLIHELTKHFNDDNVAHVVARQIPHKNASLCAQFSRHFNYPEVAYKNTRNDLKTRGIRAVFTSNSCAAYRRRDLQAIGGFATGIPSNEDAIAVSALLQAGKMMRYEPKARVYHSHNYTFTEEFRRYFDTGVAHESAFVLRFLKLSVSKEGNGYVYNEMLFFLRHAWYRIPAVVFRDFIRWLGYRCGRKHYKLPLWFKRRCAMNKSFWLSEYKMLNKA
jgi:rhamnosyltransferase